MTEINKASQQSLQRILDKIGVKSTGDKKEAVNKSTLGQEDFLKLMTTQLQNQDPFAPMENGDFIAQMAQFSTVTGITEMSNEMKAINEKIDGFRIATASQYLGHSVLVPGNVVRPNGSDEINGVIDVPNATTKLQVFFQKENGEIIGQQYPTDTGRIDILAISKDEKELLVVELKKGRASDAVVGQILTYMGYVKEEVAEENQIVKGCIIALEDDKRIKNALSMISNIDFYKYELRFKLIKS